MNCSILHSSQCSERNQKRVFLVITLTLVMMFIEILAGLLFGSVALLSDGIHMGTHAFALMITLVAYIVARKNAENPAFSFGTGKVSVLGGYTSAIVLTVAALLMVWESMNRLIFPVDIDFYQSILVAVIGLIVNIVSAFLLNDFHHHGSTGHNHGSHHHQDHNMKAAYVHVIADALTSILAITALLGGRYYGAIWLDPIVGLVGAAVILKWGYNLIIATGHILLDFEDNEVRTEKLKEMVFEISSTAKIDDLHIWRVAEGKRAIICSISGISNSEEGQMIEKTLQSLKDYCHRTIEIKA